MCVGSKFYFSAHLRRSLGKNLYFSTAIDLSIIDNGELRRTAAVHFTLRICQLPNSDHRMDPEKRAFQPL